ETVAAIIVEPVQGEGGFVVAPQAFVEGLRETCDRHGIVLIVDEVQTGFGRTGRMFAIEHYGIEPDLITVAKSIAAGLPLSAVLDVIEDEALLDRAERIGETIRGRMLAWQERHSQIGDVRGLGAMLAIELVEDRQTRNPAPTLASAVTEAAASRGLLLLKAGIHSNCIRVLCPLVITDHELEEALGAWEEALAAELG